MAVLVGTASVWLAGSAFLRTGLGELQSRGFSLASDVAARGAELVLTEDLYELHALVRDTQANNPDVAYVAVLDAAGRPLAHTFGRGFPADLLKLPRPAPDQPFLGQRLASEDGFITDVAVPILNGAAGVVHVGISEGRIRRAAAAMVARIAAAVLAAAALGTVAAFALTRILTAPVGDLMALTKAVASGDLARRAPPGPPDEFGHLVRSFNEMVAALEHSRFELQAKERLRQDLLQRLITAQEDERRRIARELHDETSQALTSFVVNLQSLSQVLSTHLNHFSGASYENGQLTLSARVVREVKERVDELRGLVGATLEEVHTLALELRPRVLDDLGLIPALERYVADFTRNFGIACELQVVTSSPHDARSRRLPGVVETSVYRIVQEALTNVARHSKAKNASVVVEILPEMVSALVEDDGVGFAVQQALANRATRPSLGLHGMRERATLLGGTLTLESSPGAGTTVCVRIPLAQAVG